MRVMNSTEYSGIYRVERVQPDTNIRYYVKENFSKTPANIQKVEKDLLGQYYEYYRSLCFNEIQMERRVCF